MTPFFAEPFEHYRYAWHRTNRRPQLPTKAALAPWTPAPSPSPPASPAPAAAEAASPAWDTVLPTFSDDLQPAPSSAGEANGSTAPAASAASATQDLTLPPAAASPSPSAAETRVETMPVQEGGTDATPQPVVLEQDGGAAIPDKVPDGGGAQHDEAPAVTPAAPRPKALGRHEHGLRTAARPQTQPTFWQRLFGHKETKKAKPGKPQP